MENKIKFIDRGHSGLYEITQEYKDTDIDINVFKNTFQNCQIYTIGGFCDLLELEQDDFHKLLYTIHKALGCKPMLCIDINRELEVRLEKYIPEEFINVKTQYESTNGSDMTIYLIKLNKFFNNSDIKAEEYDFVDSED